LDALLPLFLSFPVFQGVIMEELFPMDAVLAAEVDVFLEDLSCALILSIHSGIVVSIIKTDVKDIIITNL